MSSANHLAAERRAARNVLGVTIGSSGAFASFYSLYSAAPLVFPGSASAAGVRVAALMVVVVAVQPLVLVAGRWLRARARVVTAAMVAMAAGLAFLALPSAWLGVGLLGAGFGVFVVTSTAWTKELAAPGRAGRALGVYGFGSAIGGALGAPAGLFLAAQAGMLGVVIGGAVFALLGLGPVLAVARRVAAEQDPVPLPAEEAASSQTAKAGPMPVHTDPAADSSPGHADSAADSTPGHAGFSAGSTSPSRSSLPGSIVVPAALVAHLLAVTLYAAVLSSAGSLVAVAPAMAAVLAAFATQSAVALGRLAAGALSDRWSTGGIATVAGILLVGAIALFTTADSPVAVVAASATVGASAGAVQIAALTLMMHRAHTPARIEQVSTAWNIAFDTGLGAGALAAGLTALG